MAATADFDDDTIVIECRDPNLIEPAESTSLTEIFISTDDIASWDLSTIPSHDIIKVKINRNRLVEESSYFQSLLSGNFSESSMCCFPIKWSSGMFLHTLRFMHGYHLEVTFCSFLPLYHTALYFGLERLMLECKSWFSDISERVVSSSQLQFDDLIYIWDYGYEQDYWFGSSCSYMNGLPTEKVSLVRDDAYMWAISADSFVHLPYSYLVSCVKHPHLTVDSERHLCEALLAWVSTNSALVDQMSCNGDVWTDKSNLVNITKDDCNDVLEELMEDTPRKSQEGAHRELKILT
ncbi:hypothetical protein Cgig2_002697 [Carnegiea gigantea]|uniref:BTB domain-containing protein n=1 Tax=Carnegiea gigantea TaxID=171969 RepID=A0A9Q1QLI8_9CARY|nr:hypothetical protein Cgig2_002697 [Carnegiea gigantea]